jgi:dephospho-CoA kinase
MKLVIGIVGPPLAGKETCADLLANLLVNDGYLVSRHTFSDILRETLDLWDIPHGRNNEQKMAIIMNAESGFKDGALGRAMRKRLMEDTSDVAVLDGVRWISDEKMIRSLGDEGIKTILIYISADAKVRYERMLSRDRAGEGSTSWEEFERQGKMENEIHIEDICTRAELVLHNDYENIDNFKRDIERVYENLFDRST